MLILAGIEIEIVGDGRQRPMLCLCPPNSPGTHYRVETDLATANRLRYAMAQEVARLGQMSCMGGPSEAEDEPHEPERRF